MPAEPDAPARLQDLVEAFAQTAQAVVELARTCSEDDLAQPTECPGWTVHDQISHVVGVEAWLQGHKDPRVEVPPYAHVRNDLGKRVEYAVELRRSRTGAQVLSELEDVLAQRLSTLRDPSLTGTDSIPGPFGPDRATAVMLFRIFDVWTHEQDIRSALGRPGNLDSPAATVFVTAVMGQLPKLIATRARVEPGHSVIIEVSGPTTARQGVRIDLDEQGRRRGHVLTGADVPAETSPANDHDASPDTSPHDRATATATDPRSEDRPDHQVTICLSTEAFTRRAAGRRSVSDTAYDVIGDDATARRVLEALVVTH